MTRHKSKFTLDRARINSDILAGIERVEIANNELEKAKQMGSDTAATGADTCVETRYAEATFYDVSRWAGQVDEQARDLLVLAFDKSVKLLFPGNKKYYDAVLARLKAVKEFKIPATAPARV